MKHCLLTLSFCLILGLNSFLSLAQTNSKFGIGFNYSPAFSFVQHSNQGGIDSELFDEIKASEYGIITHNVELFAVYKLSSKFEINLGIGFHNCGYQTRNYTPQIDNFVFDQVKFKTNASYFTIPINVNYFITDQFFLAAGVSLGLNLSHSTRRYETLGNEESSSKAEANDEATSIYSFLNFKMGYHFDFPNSFEFRIAPIIRYSPSDYLTNDALINRRFLEIGGEFILIKNF